MKISTINALICILLMMVVVLFSIFHISDLVYDNPVPAKPSYDLTGQQSEESAPQAAPHVVTLDERLAKANLNNGKKVFGQCALCHTPEKDGPNRVGPGLWGVVGRQVAALPHFNYSRAMRAFGAKSKHWDDATLDIYLRSPQRLVPGTTMSFIGIKKDQDRADLILYLKSLTDDAQ